MPYLRTLSTFRDGIRQLAIGGKDDSETALKEILMLCDSLRDSDLVPLGVALDDQEGSSFLPFAFCLLPFPSSLFPLLSSLFPPPLSFL